MEICDGKYRVDFIFYNEEFDFEVLIGDSKIGYAWGLADGDKLKLSDINIDSESIAAPGIALRRQGIGSELLRRFLAEADQAAFSEVWGCVVQDDIDNNPALLAWYKRFGFELLLPDDDCVKGSLWKIVRRQSARQLESAGG